MFSLTVAVGDTTAPDNIPKPSSLIGFYLALVISVLQIQINKENDSNLSIKKNIIMNDNVAISMDNITKVKILNNNDNPNFKKLLIKEIQDNVLI